MRNLIVMSTTIDWNVGDDVIRDGVMRLLNIEADNVMHLDRGIVRLESGHESHVWRVKPNSLILDELMPCAEAFVLAGTPEWLNFMDDVWDRAVAHKVPIYAIGVGMVQEVAGPNLLRIAHDQGLLRCFTARDYGALGMARSVGVEDARWFVDPAFHASYPTREKTNVVVNYRLGGNTGSVRSACDEFWKKVVDKVDPDVVSVHEVSEFGRARILFPGRDIFFSSDAKTFMGFYASCREYYGGRIHGATQVAASGGRACLFHGCPDESHPDDQRVDCVRRATEHLNGGVRTIHYGDVDAVKLPNHGIDREILAMDFEAHRSYLTERWP